MQFQVSLVNTGFQAVQQIALQIKCRFEVHKAVRIAIPQDQQLWWEIFVPFPKLQQHRKEICH